MDLHDRRRDYRHGELMEHQVGEDPLAFFQQWYQEVEDRDSHEANAMVLATVDARQRPSSRVVLLKGVDDKGLCFFTNTESRKAQEMTRHPFASLLFHWPSHERQVRVEGAIELCSREDSQAYFSKRPRTSQIGAWASPQSQVIANRDELEERFGQLEKVHSRGDIPLPPFWGGYRLVPDLWEFWQGRPSRLHDRIRFQASDTGWEKARLAP